MTSVVEHEADCSGERLDVYESHTDTSGGHAIVRRCLNCAAENVEWIVRPEVKMYDPWPGGHMHPVSEGQLGRPYPRAGGGW